MHRLGLRATLLALAAVAAIAAATLAATANARSQATTITFWQTMNDQETVTLKSLVSQFEASHPDIKIDMVTVPFDQHAQKFTTAAQAGQAPDVMRADTAPDVQGWAAQGLLTDLTSMISAADKADFVQAAFKGAQYNGKAYAVPQTVDALALFYNKVAVQGEGAHDAAEDAGAARERTARSSATARASPSAVTPTGSSRGSGATAAASSTWRRSRS